MNLTRRFTIVVMAVALVLVLTGVALYVLLPPRLVTRAEEGLALRAHSAGAYMAPQVRRGLEESDSVDVQKAVELALLEADLAYAVVVGDKGFVIASATDAAERGGRWEAAEQGLIGEDIEDYAHPIVLDDWIVATLYVGFHKGPTWESAEQDALAIAGFSLFLILLALAAGFGFVQMERLRRTAMEWQQRHKSVRLHAGTLKSSVREHRETEKHLKESESKYKSLFESTVESAMADLEDLNSHLEQRKEDLEYEVGVRKQAEHTLRRYTKRLQLLNAIERSLLENAPADASASLAVAAMMDLVPATRLVLIEKDDLKGTADIIALQSERASSRKVGDSVRPRDVPGSAAMSYDKDLTGKTEPSELERVLMAEGVRSVVNIPMAVQGEVVGVLRMEAEEAGCFEDEHLSIGRDVADLLAIGVHRARLEEQREAYEEELIREKDRAEDMARLKTAFLTNMSHEIRTPISGIMGFSQVLHEEVPDGLREFTGLIQEAAKRLLYTINSVLELARLESGKAVVEAVPMDLGEEVLEASKLLEPAALRKGLRYEIATPPDPAWCVLDKACVERIVTNLVDNAIKFTPAGNVKISVSTKGQEALLRVSDTGVGIGEEFLSKLFDEFRQEQSDANREHEGAGLGLSITRKLVERLGGVIMVESRQGVGTTVLVRFPLMEIARNGRQLLTDRTAADSPRRASPNGGVSEAPFVG